MFKQKPILVTTTESVDGYRVSEYLELSCNLFIEQCENPRNLAKTINQIVEKSTNHLNRDAHKQGADAVLGVHFVSDVIPLWDAGFLVKAHISGTPVKLEVET